MLDIHISFEDSDYDNAITITVASTSEILLMIGFEFLATLFQNVLPAWKHQV